MSTATALFLGGLVVHPRAHRRGTSSLQVATVPFEVRGKPEAIAGSRLTLTEGGPAAST